MKKGTMNMYRPCLHCDGKYDREECAQTCEYGYDKVRLMQYEETGLEPEEITENITTALQKEIKNGIQPYISEVADLNYRLKAKDKKIAALESSIKDLYAEINRLTTEHQNSGLQRDIPKKPKYRISELSDKSKFTTWYCPVCKGTVSNWEDYCNYCGQRLAERKYDPSLEIKENKT